MNAQECLKVLREVSNAIWLPTGVKAYIDYAISCVQAIERVGELDFDRLIRQHQIDIGSHNYGDFDRKEIRACSNVDIDDLVSSLEAVYAKRLLEKGYLEIQNERYKEEIEGLRKEVERLKKELNNG